MGRASVYHGVRCMTSCGGKDELLSAFFEPHNTQERESVGDFLLTITHFQRIWLVVVEGETLAPIDGGLLGADGVVPEADRLTHLVEQRSWGRFHCGFSPTRVDFFRLPLYNAFT
jgi:hypothetical protein